MFNIKHKTYFLFSKNTTLELVDQVFENHDKDVLDLKSKTEKVWEGAKSKRERRSMATREAPGFCLFGDNVGKVVDKRHHTDLDNKGKYLHMAQVIAIENRIPTSHYRYLLFISYWLVLLT